MAETPQQTAARKLQDAQQMISLTSLRLSSADPGTRVARMKDYVIALEEYYVALDNAKAFV